MQQRPLMTPFTDSRALNQKTPPPKMSLPPRSKTVSSHEAVQMIMQSARDLLSEEQKANLPSETAFKFYATKLVNDILDYCNRRDDDFPVALIYTCVELIIKRLDDAKVDELTGSSAPVKRIKQDDTEFEFAVDNISVVGLSAEADFNSIKPKLNLYRRVRVW